MRVRMFTAYLQRHLITKDDLICHDICFLSDDSFESSLFGNGLCVLHDSFMCGLKT